MPGCATGWTGTRCARGPVPARRFERRACSPRWRPRSQRTIPGAPCGSNAGRCAASCRPSGVAARQFSIPGEPKRASCYRRSRDHSGPPLGAGSLAAGVRSRWRSSPSVSVRRRSWRSFRVCGGPCFRPTWRPERAGESTSSADNRWTETGVISNDAAPDLFFHTLEEDAPAIIVDLGTVQRLHKLEVTYRIDCCHDRAQPLEVAVSTDGSNWKRVAYRRIEFSEWAPSFSPTAGRFVRLRVPRRSPLHLARIAVY